jgi:hypothetical protein
MPSIVRTDLEFHLWSDAQVHNEWATSKFWEHIIRDKFPCKDNWVVASQQPPSDDSEDRRRVELVVEHWSEGSMHRVFIFEAKKHLATQSEIDTLEHQAYEACLTHLVFFERDHMFAITTIGTRARLWVAHRDYDYLIPWIPNGTTLADKGSYIEAYSTDGHEIENALTYMKEKKQMSRSRLQKLLSSVNTAVESNQAQLSPSDSSAVDSPDYSFDYTADTRYGSTSAATDSYSYPAASQSASGSRSSYTVPIHSSSSTIPLNPAEPASGSHSSYTVPIHSSSSTIPLNPAESASDSGRFSNPSEEGSYEDVEEHSPRIPDDSLQVQLQVETIDGSEVYHFYVGKDYYKRELSDWKDGSVELNGKLYSCVFCTGKNTGQHFYTWDL